jgi:predicted cupin superfamily sugar epimerase
MNKESIIKSLGLLPHPEGGYYKETYRSEGEISNADLGGSYSGNRNYSTAIYFMLTEDTFSAFHKINQDEFWHFHMGDPIEFHTINEQGEHSILTIGNDIVNGELPQHCVAGGDWFAARVSGSQGYALVSCTVSPGFDFRDFVLPTANELIQKFPQHEKVIKEFTRT